MDADQFGWRVPYFGPGSQPLSQFPQKGFAQPLMNIKVYGMHLSSDFASADPSAGAP
jgi:hypothetical protein